MKMGCVQAGLSPLGARPQGLQRWLGLVAEPAIAVAACLVSLIASCSVLMLKINRQKVTHGSVDGHTYWALLESGGGVGSIAGLLAATCLAPSRGDGGVMWAALD